MTSSSNITLRLCRLDDASELEQLISLSARELQATCYTAAQIEGALGTVFGVDTQLIRDGTYFAAEAEGRIVGCGGWSRRSTLFGGDRGRVGEAAQLNPATDAARIRAFFVHPHWARRGIGRALMERSERCALEAGFSRIDIVATLPGELLYRSFDYTVVKRDELPLRNGARLPVVQLTKTFPRA